MNRTRIIFVFSAMLFSLSCWADPDSHVCMINDLNEPLSIRLDITGIHPDPLHDYRISMDLAPRASHDIIIQPLVLAEMERKIQQAIHSCLRISLVRDAIDMPAFILLRDPINDDLALQFNDHASLNRFTGGMTIRFISTDVAPYIDYRIE